MKNIENIYLNAVIIARLWYTQAKINNDPQPLIDSCERILNCAIGQYNQYVERQNAKKELTYECKNK